MDTETVRVRVKLIRILLAGANYFPADGKMCVHGGEGVCVNMTGPIDLHCKGYVDHVLLGDNAFCRCKFLTDENVKVIDG